ncbi:MAG: hypothetical protein ACJAZN_002360 [Planctomycetota bacterium]|jgi:hypothetical protein
MITSKLTRLRPAAAAALWVILGLGLPVAGAMATFSGAPAPAPAPPLVDDGFESALVQLELSPDDPSALLAASEASFAEADDDRALWYAELARIAAEGTDAERDVEKKVRAIRDEIGIEVPLLGRSVDAYSKELFNFARACSGKKYYANAADLLGSLDDSPYERAASSILEKLFKKDKAIKAMLATGVPINVAVKKLHSEGELKRLNRTHTDWTNPYKAEGENYTIVTDMGVEIGDQMLGAMEQMNTFYRQIFEYKERGGTMRRCEVRVWKTREEFDEYNADIDPNVKGFYRPDQNNVSTYDPRTEPNGSSKTIENLWSTLYHEASHQFTRAVWKNPIPTWLNEGTASYFEGAALLTGGVVETNRIPRSRLSGLVHYLGIDDLWDRKEGSSAAGATGRYVPSDDSPGLKSVVSYMAPGSYPGEYYPFGWGLVYFCLNYEDENAERIYAPIYKDFMKSYYKTGGVSPLQRFKVFFVEEPGIEGIETFEDFENRWIDWIAELARREFGLANQADKLIAQGRHEIENDHADYAIQSLRWALRKRPEDPTAMELLGNCYLDTKNKDAALFTFRALATKARGTADQEADLEGYDGTAAEALEAAIAGLSKVDSSIGRKLSEGITGFVDDSLAEANAWVEAGYPRVGLQAIAMATEVLGGDGRLQARATEIQTEAGVNVMRTRRLPVANLDGWNVSGADWETAEKGTDRVLTTAGGRDSTATLSKAPPKLFRFTVDIEQLDTEATTLPGITFAGGPGGNRMFVMLGTSGTFGFLEFDEKTGQPKLDRDLFKRGPRAEDGKVTMSIEVGPVETRFFAGDKELGSIELPPSAFEGQVGLFCVGATRFVNPRLAY